MKYQVLPLLPPPADLWHYKVTVVTYLSVSLTHLQLTGSRPQHHSEVELQSISVTDETSDEPSHLYG